MLFLGGIILKMQKYFTPLAIDVAGLLIALSNLYVNGKVGFPFVKKAGQVSTPREAAKALSPQVKEMLPGNSPFLG